MEGQATQVRFRVESRLITYCSLLSATDTFLGESFTIDS